MKRSDKDAWDKLGTGIRDFFTLAYHQILSEEQPELRVIFNKEEIRQNEVLINSQACYVPSKNEIHLYPTQWYSHDKDDTEWLIWMINHEHLHHTLIKHIPDLLLNGDEVKHHIPYYLGLDRMEFGERVIDYKDGRASRVPGWFRIKYSIIDMEVAGEDALRWFSHKSFYDRIWKGILSR